jgi:hypothetical protein
MGAQAVRRMRKNKKPLPSPPLKGRELNFTEFLDAFGVQKLQKKDFPALEGGTPKAGGVFLRTQLLQNSGDVLGALEI